LILAALRRRDEEFRNWFMRAVESRAATPRERLVAIYDVLEEWFADSRFKGCTFINASSEFGDKDDPVHATCAEHKHLVLGFVRDLAAAAGIDLYLCGHTHGGQIRLPWGHAPVKNLSRCREYQHGLWRHEQMTGYTSAGAGVSCIPIRYNCPPEVTLITLHRPGSTLANPESP